MRLALILLASATLFATSASAAEERVTSPDGKLALVVSDDDGLRYRVELDGQSLLADSDLGLAFADGTPLGPDAKITATKESARDTTWDDPFGQRRTVPDRFRELRIELSEPSTSAAHARTFALRLQPVGGYAAVINPE